MIIYRGIKNTLFKNIDPLFRNKDASLLDYGPGTSYAYDRFLAEEYCQFGRSVIFSYLIKYEFSPKNPLSLTSYNTIDEDGFEYGVFLDNQIIPRKHLAEYASKQGYDCIMFEYDENDPHIMLLDNCLSQQLELIDIELFSENQELVDTLRKMKLSFDGQFFGLPLDKINEIDLILFNYLNRS